MRRSLHALLRNPYVWVVLIAFTIRLTTLGMYPLGDTTEARYGEIARKMVETGNWITPQFDYGVPFWGKPPLSTWTRAASFELFGVSEFSARLPSIFVSLAIVALMFYLGRQQRGRTVAWIASAMLSTSVLFFILSGAVLMDPLMTVGTTLSMVAFWQAMKDRGRHWGYLLFVGLAIGLMSKGPVAGVLTTIPIVIWLTLTGNWRHGWSRIPLFVGTLLMLAISLPWYLLAEYTTPGFLDYFIVGEHWKRFTEPGWQGDLYGSAHTSARGAIWVEWLVAAFPVSLILIGAFFTLLWKKKSATIWILREDWTLYLILWAISPMLFFTFSGNILATYVLPGLPAAALLAAGLWQTSPEAASQDKGKGRKSIAILAMAGVLFPLFYLLVIFVHMPKVAEQNSEKYLVQSYQQLDPRGQARLIYLYKRPFSAEYYSKGKAEVISHPRDMLDIVRQEPTVFFAIPADYINQVPEEIRPCLQKIERPDRGRARYILFQARQKDCHLKEKAAN